jgi:hypothetical protein
MVFKSPSKTIATNQKSGATFDARLGNHQLTAF